MPIIVLAIVAQDEEDDLREPKSCAKLALGEFSTVGRILATRPKEENVFEG